MRRRAPLLTRRLVLGLALSALLAAPVQACIWDMDTLAAEAQGLPETIDAITGRFDRNPPLYYEMRLARTRGLLRADPANLAAYDDAAVACDRLGRSEEAIKLIEAKRRQLERLPAHDPVAKEHRYRYLANAGTFWAHRWFREGADRKHLEMLRRGRDLIKQAIELNPNAHFGREKYQLRFMDWILHPPKPDPENLDATFLGVRRETMRSDPTGDLERKGLGDAVRGLSGLIVLGNAWESVDIYDALAVALQHEGHSSLSYLAERRCIELIAANKRSLDPNAPTGSELVHWVASHHPLDDEKKLDAEYARLRSQADLRNARRTEFMLARLRAGRHPDTDPTFWEGYSETSGPLLSGWIPTGVWQSAPLAAGVLLLLWLIRKVRRRKA